MTDPRAPDPMDEEGREPRSRLGSLLVEAALRAIHDGASAMEEGRSDDGAAALQMAARILTALHSALDRDDSPELAASFARIYRTLGHRLTDARLLRDCAAARAVGESIELLAQALSAAATPASKSRRGA